MGSPVSFLVLAELGAIWSSIQINAKLDEFKCQGVVLVCFCLDWTSLGMLDGK
jgi:hypothetical protein